MPLKAYRTVSAASEVETGIQKSRFIGRCYPVSKEAQALELLAELRKRHWDANHNCYAYSIGADGSIARYSDDGEPGGTAGLPMMEALRNKQVTDVLCVVTRYFGGILLGAGGLVRAYSRSASDAIEAARPVWMKPCAIFAVQLEYSRWGSLEPLLRQYGVMQEIAYAEDVTALVQVPFEAEADFCKAVVEKSDGRVQPERRKECYGAFPEDA